MNDAKQSAPPAELERQICSSTVPKNEREWWAHHEIARLRAEVERLKARDEEWQRKASAWVASPEAAQRLEGYRELAQKLNAAEAAKDGAYLERNQCVALIARMAHALGYWAGTAKTAIEGWSEDWHGCVYIDLPAGQVSWHYHDTQSYLFDWLPPYCADWDGHDTPEKYRRVLDRSTMPNARAEKAEAEYARIAGDYSEEASYLRKRAEQAEAEVERLMEGRAALMAEIEMLRERIGNILDPNDYGKGIWTRND